MRSPRRRLSAAAAVTVAALALVAGCSSSDDQDDSATPSDSVSYALSAGFTPNWILPISTTGHTNTNTFALLATLWEPLVAVDGTSGTIEEDEQASIADSYEFSEDGTVLTITLKDRTWSDGEPITSRDVEFWYDLVSANKESWASYVEGSFPDNVTDFTVVDDSTVSFTFDQAYNQSWILFNSQINLITPLPYHAWAKTSDDEEVDVDANLDRTAEGATAIYDYLVSEAEDVASYADNPLWQVVSGPYTVSEFTTSGQVTLTKNDAYDGDDPASITTVNLMPFTTVDAEENAVRAGQVDYGYISSSSLDQEDTFTDLGYTVDPWEGWSITYIVYNFNSATNGAVFDQLYVRQAIQMSVDQDSISSVIQSGASTPSYGPVPQSADSDYVSQTQLDEPYSYDTSAAQELLTSHGWEIGSDGVAVCEDAGTGDTQCGEGVAAGTRLSMTLVSQSGSTVTDNMMTEIQSSLAETGIELEVNAVASDQVLSQTPKCEEGAAECTWDLSFFGTAGSWYFPAFPAGDQLFATSGAANFGSYSDADVDALITASHTATDDAAIQDYSATLAEDLPVIWLPSPTYQVSVIDSDLQGVTQDPMAYFHPQRWSW
ncbi:MAG TPA: peptide ABC transporter substrate-binding protein [Cellulomonas sp.]